MSRSVAEQTNRLSIFFLNEHGYLPQGKSLQHGGITWTMGDWKNNISFWISTYDNYIELIYTVTVNWSGEKSDMRYKIPLTTTLCNYGGHRYWFICPLYKNGQFCGRRVGVIYSVDKWFGCRYCADIAYQAQFEGGIFRTGSVTEPEVEKAYNKIKRFYYAGRPTRQYRRYLILRQKMDNSWIRAGLKFGIKI